MRKKYTYLLDRKHYLRNMWVQVLIANCLIFIWYLLPGIYGPWDILRSQVIYLLIGIGLVHTLWVYGRTPSGFFATQVYARAGVFTQTVGLGLVFGGWYFMPLVGIIPSEVGIALVFHGLFLSLAQPIFRPDPARQSNTESSEDTE